MCQFGDSAAPKAVSEEAHSMKIGRLLRGKTMNGCQAGCWETSDEKGTVGRTHVLRLLVMCQCGSETKLPQADKAQRHREAF